MPSSVLHTCETLVPNCKFRAVHFHKEDELLKALLFNLSLGIEIKELTRKE